MGFSIILRYRKQMSPSSVIAAVDTSACSDSLGGMGPAHAQITSLYRGVVLQY